ncbi:hypothetical protein WH47_01807, partial [Habropoda laboriosa]
VTRLVQLFMQRGHFIGQSVLVSAVLDSKVYRNSAYQPSRYYSPKRQRDIAIGGEDGCCTRRSHSDTRSKFRLGISFPLEPDTSFYYIKGSPLFIFKMRGCCRGEQAAWEHVLSLYRWKDCWE